jgi:hypothetical protein
MGNSRSDDPFLVLFYSVKVDGIRTLEMRNDRWGVASATAHGAAAVLQRVVITTNWVVRNARRISRS